MSILEKPDKQVPILKGKELADEFRDISKRQGIDLSLADMEETKKILSKLPTSLSEEIVDAREN